jgi:hypothetical protein
MEPEELLPLSQQPTSFPYPEPNQFSPVSTNFFKIHSNIILPYRCRLFKRTLSLRFPYQNTVCTFAVSHTYQMPHPSRSLQFGHRGNNWWGVQIMKLRIMRLRVVHCCLVPLRPKRLHLYTILEYLQPVFCQCEGLSFTCIQSNRQNYNSAYFNNLFLFDTKSTNILLCSFATFLCPSDLLCSL